MDAQLFPTNALRTRNTRMPYLSSVGCAATRLRSCQDLPSPLNLEYASRQKKWLRGYAVVRTSPPL